jgi:hypothetical protein
MFHVGTCSMLVQVQCLYMFNVAANSMSVHCVGGWYTFFVDACSWRCMFNVVTYCTRCWYIFSLGIFSTRTYSKLVIVRCWYIIDVGTYSMVVHVYVGTYLLFVHMESNSVLNQSTWRLIPCWLSSRESHSLLTQSTWSLIPCWLSPYGVLLCVDSATWSLTRCWLSPYGVLLRVDSVHMESYSVLTQSIRSLAPCWFSPHGVSLRVA